MKMLFGKYKDKEIADIPLEYLHWLANNVELKGALKWSVCKHLKMNVDDLEQLRTDYNAAIEENKVLKEEVAKLQKPSGKPAKAAKNNFDSLYRKLAMKYHPDRGGDEIAMKVVNEIFDEIRGQ